MSVDEPTTPTLAAVRRARARHEATLRWLRPAGLVAALIIAVRAYHGDPPPGWSGAGLGITLALCAVAAGGVGLLAAYRAADEAQAALFALFLAGSLAIAWLQPGGPGLIGALVGVGVVARRLPGRLSAVPVAGALVVLPLAALADGARHPAIAVLLSEAGLAAVYGGALLGRRIGEGNVQAERLLLELDRTRSAEIRAATLTERQRLAREMHDVLAHSLSGLTVQLEGARLLHAADPADPRLGGVLDRAHHLARRGVQEARWTIGMLRGDELPGPDRLAALVAEFERDTGVPSRFTVAGDQCELPAGVRLALYRVAQEALTNVRKHAHPDRVEVGLAYEADGVAVVVEDFGAPAGPPSVSPPPPPSPSSSSSPPPPSSSAREHDEPGDTNGYGLTGMRERAELLGGTLHAAPTGSGFRVTLRVPLRTGGPD